MRTLKINLEKFWLLSLIFLSGGCAPNPTEVAQEWIDKGWVKITAERDEGPDQYDLIITFKQFFAEEEELPFELTAASQMMLTNIADSDFAAYMQDGGGLGVAEADNILLDIV